MEWKGAACSALGWETFGVGGQLKVIYEELVSQQCSRFTRLRDRLDFEPFFPSVPQMKTTAVFAHL